MAIRFFFPTLAAVALLSGCSSLIVSSTPPPVYYKLDYAPPAVTCEKSFPQGIRVREFTSSSPFDRTAMVVVKPDGEVLFSGSFQWVATPGTLVAQSLLRDLGQGSLFPRVASASSPDIVPLELTGHVFTFAWEKNGAEARAVLQVEVSLTDGQNPGRLRFRKMYRLQGATFREEEAKTFASAMSALMAEFSAKLQQDLCAGPAGSES